MTALLSVEGLTVHFKVRHGLSRKSTDVVHAADDVTLSLDAGRTLALVGESGSGKTTVARAVLQPLETDRAAGSSSRAGTSTRSMAPKGARS